MTETRRVRSWAALTATAVLMTSGDVWGQAKLLSTEELTNRAVVVAVAKVSSAQSEWSAERERIFTRVTLSVEQFLKGEQHDRTITLIVPGGEIDGVGELYTHTAKFKPQEEVLVFAERDSRGNLRVVAGEQGKFTVIEDNVSSRNIVGDDQALDVLVEKIKAVVRASKK